MKRKEEGKKLVGVYARAKTLQWSVLVRSNPEARAAKAAYVEGIGRGGSRPPGPRHAVNFDRSNLLIIKRKEEGKNWSA